MNKIIIILFSFLIGCSTSSESEDEAVFVSIAPLRYIVQQIVGTEARIEVLAPETSSPESYEPTVQQIRRLSDAEAYISIGLIDFEQALGNKVGEIAPHTALLTLSAEIDLLQEAHNHHSRQPRGADPHIWLSPRRVKQIGNLIATHFGELHPDSAEVYRARAERFAARIDTLDRYIRQAVAGAERKSFAIAHPALAYFAEDYGLRQIVIEEEGKEPSVQQMKRLADSLQRTGIKTVLFQRQTSDAAARAIARELPDGRAVAFDPLAEDWLGNMYRLADSLHVILNE